MVIQSTLSQPDVHRIIMRELVETHFQPIVSIRRKSILGVEALSRGVDDAGQLIAPLTLYGMADEAGVALELDRVCRAAALRNFLPLHAHNKYLILFVNAHASTINEGGDAMMKLVREIGLPPQNVAIEILESQFEDTQLLREAVAHYKDCGFLMAIDDLGAGYSNLDRIGHVKPDILKADASLIRDIHLEYHKQEVYKSLVNLSEKIGGWVITEGIEKKEEAVASLELGGDIFQGYYFARPHKITNSEIQCHWSSIEATAAQFKRQILCKLKADRTQHQERVRMIDTIAGELKQPAPQNLEASLLDCLWRFKSIESACLLDENGVQVSETILNPRPMQPQKTIIFRPPPKGTDHSLKEYFYALREMPSGIYETRPYVPLPCGQLCITVSSAFRDRENHSLILCLHVNAS